MISMNSSRILIRGALFFSELADAAKEKYDVDLAVENVSRQHLLSYLLEQIDAPRLGCVMTAPTIFLEEQRLRPDFKNTQAPDQGPAPF